MDKSQFISCENWFKETFRNYSTENTRTMSMIAFAEREHEESFEATQRHVFLCTELIIHIWEGLSYFGEYFDIQRVQQDARK